MYSMYFLVLAFNFYGNSCDGSDNEPLSRNIGYNIRCLILSRYHYLRDL